MADITLIKMITSVRDKLIEEPSTREIRTSALVGLINDSASEILEGYDWPFDTRHDGKAFFPAPITSTTGGNFTDGSASGAYDNGTTVDLLKTSTALDTAAECDHVGWAFCDPRRARIVGTGTAMTGTSWIVTNIDHATTKLTLTLSNNLNVAPVTNVAWSLYAIDQVLPSTVRKVLSAANEQQNLSLQWVERESEFDTLVPKMHATTSDTTECIFIGGTITSTARTATNAWNDLSTTTATTGDGIMIWPPPASDTQVNYSYQVQHTPLALASDTFPNVPDDVIYLIEWNAVKQGFETGIANDPQRAQIAYEQSKERLQRALMAHRVKT